VTRPSTLKARDRKPPALGSKVRVEAAHLSPAADESGLPNLINGSGLLEIGGLKAHGTNASDMWLGDWKNNLAIEFELPETVPLAAVEVWNFNADWQTTNGIRKADVAVSADGASWQTVLRAVEFAEAEGTADYDSPVVLKLDGVKARKVRFENIVPRSSGGKVGLSEVLFHQAGSQAGPVQPEDGIEGLPLKNQTLAWTPVTGATAYRVSFGTDPAKLSELLVTNQTQCLVSELPPQTACYWRVDAVMPGGQTVTGRVARFETGGLVAWWKLDETQGTNVADASGHGHTGTLIGTPAWADGALELDGKEARVNCGVNGAFNFRGAMTVSFWMKVRKFDKTWQATVTKGDHAWRFQRTGDTNTMVFIPAGLSSSQAPGATEHRPWLFTKRPVDDNQWHHIVGLWDGQRAAFYLDGQLEDSIAATGTLFQDNEPVMIGDNSMFNGRYFNGWLDDVRLYSYGLGEEEVQALHRAGRPAVKSDK
jgi:hypothetical protein